MRLVTEADVAGYYDYAVYINRPDGVTVSIAVGNGTLDGTPHLAKQGWQKVVESPKWHL